MRSISFTETQLREAIAESRSFAEALRRIGLRPAGGNHGTIKKYAARWGISTEHFGSPRGHYPRGGRKARPLEDVLVVGSTYQRGQLKQRLFAAGLKQPVCELCGQGELWRGRRMALILDHVNGNATDNRLENLRIVCANCNATLETHCGRNKPRGQPPRVCDQCGESFRARHADQRFCSRACSSAHNGPRSRRVERPTLEELERLVKAVGYLETGRRLGVSDNAVRKWFRSYGKTPPPGRGRELHPPPPPPPVLTNDEARHALQLLARGVSMYAVAKLLGVSRTTVSDLRRGITYRHVERPRGLRDVA